MKKLFLTAIILLALLASSAMAQTNGNIDLGFLNSSVTGTESFNLKTNIGVRDGDTKTELAFSLNKEQTKDIRNQMDIAASVQYSILVNSAKTMYGFGAMKYDRDIAYSVDDSTSVGCGIGYFPGFDIPAGAINYFIQTGLFLNTSYYDDNSYDRKTLLNVSCGIDQPFGDRYTVFALFDGDLNLDEVRSSDSVFNDYETETEAGLIVNIGDNTNIKAAYSWKYNHLAEVEDQRVYGVKLGVKF